MVESINNLLSKNKYILGLGSKSSLLIITIINIMINCIVINAKLYGMFELECKKICGINKLNRTLNISMQ